MKTLRRHRLFINNLLVFLLASWQIGQPLQAATFYWDADGSAAGNNVDGTGLGGTGNWNTTTPNWWDLAALTTWPNTSADIGIFTGPAVLGTPTSSSVTVSSGILANQLRFLRSGYTLTGGDITLAGTTPTLHAALGESATISSQLLGSAGLTKTGGGSIRLTNSSNSYTGVTTISNGSLIITDPAQLGTDASAVSILTNNNAPQNTNLLGFTGGSLVLDGTSTGFTFSRNVNFEGRGPIGDRGSAILSLGNNTLAGTLSSAVSPLTPATIRNSRINSVNGTLTFSGTLNAGGTSATTITSLGGVNSAGAGDFNLTGVLAGTGSIEKSGAGTLFLNPSSTSGFSGTVRITGSSTGQQSSVRVTQTNVGGVSVFGTNTVSGDDPSAIDMNGGVLEFRNDGNLDFSSLAGGKNVYLRANSTFYTGPAAGGAVVNGLTTLGTFRVAANTTASYNSRNGFGMTFGAWTQESSNNNQGIANNLGGTLLFTGDAWNNADSSARNLTFSGNGNTRIVGSITASGTTKNVIKQGAGELILNGTGGTFTGETRIEGGAVRITDFRSLNNASLVAISLGNATTTGGSLIIGGTGVGTASVAGLTTSKPITLNTTSGSNSIYANQTGTNPVILNGSITKIAAATTGALILGGTNTADNIINVVIPVETTPSTGGVTKLGAGTWVLNAANTYAGATTIQNGTLKLRATAAASDVIREAATNTIVFSANGTTNTAGGTLEFRGISGATTTETLGALTPTAGAATVRLLGNGGSAANLTFTSLGATTAASSLNFDTTGANGGLITLTGQAATTATNLPGTSNLQGHLYINGADFATINGSAQVVAPTYAGSGNFQNAAGGLVATVHNKLTGSFTNAAATVSSLVTNSQTLTMSGNLTVSTGGILQSGGTATLQSNDPTSRLILGGAAATNIAIRVNTASDVLNLGTATNPVNVGSAQTAGLTKNGAGTLVIFGTNAQTGTTNINEGTVRLSGANARLSANGGTAAALVIRQGAKLELDGVTAANAVFNNNLDGAGIITNVNAVSATIQINGSGIWNGIFQDGAGVLNVTKGGNTGAPTWNGLSTYTGVTTIAGTTGLVTVNTLADGGVASGIGASSNAASNLVFTGSTAGLVYQGNIFDGALTLGSRSASTDRLFTLSGTGATLSSTATNNNAIVWSNTGAIVHGIIGPQTLVLTGTSTGDNTFNPQLTDSGTGANITSLTKAGAGQWNLGSINNTFTGATTLNEGILGLNNNGALPTNSPLVLTPTSATSAAVIQMSGTFERNLAATATAGTGTVTFGFSIASTTGGVGFAAHSTPLTVAIGGVSSPTALTWGSGGFVGTGGVQNLVLNSTTALSSVDFRNAIDLGASTRTVNVLDNANTGADFATISGVLSGTGGGLTKIGTGVLRLAAANIYTGLTTINEGTLVVQTLGNSTNPGLATSVGLSTNANLSTSGIVLGRNGNNAGLLQYVGPGETSDRFIQLGVDGGSGSSQIHADGAGPLILTNVNNTANLVAKTLFLRGSNAAGNMITSQLTDNTGALSVTIDGGATWILTNSANSYTGTTTVSGGAFGIGSNTAYGGALTISNGNVFAYGADRTLANTLNLGNNATSGFIGDYSLTFNGTNNFTAGDNNINVYNSIASGRALTFNGLLANSLTATRQMALDGPGDTVINGNFTTSTAFGVNIVKTGNGILTLGTNGASSNWNQAGNALDLDRGTVRFTTNNAIPAAATSSGLTFSPEVATTDTATLDLNGTTQTINALTATTDGTVIIDNTSASPASFTFGANNATVNFGTGLGTYTITDSGAGALSIFKAGTTSTTIPRGVTLSYQGTTGVTGGSMTILAPTNGTSGLSVTNPGSTLSLTGGITAPTAVNSIIVENGGTLNLLDGAGSQFSNLATLTLGSNGGTMTTLGLNVGDSLVAGDELNTDLLSLLGSGTLNLFAGNQITLNLTDAGLNPNQEYDLLTFAPGGFTSGPLGVGDWILGATPGGFSSITLNKLNDRIYISTGTLITGKSYWNAGGTLDNWNDVSNWAVTNKDGLTPAISIPGQGTDVVFIADNITGGAAITTTLEQNFKINSLTFEASTTPANTPSSVTINPGASSTNRIEIAPQSPADGIAITTGGPASVNLVAPVRLGTNQTWTVADATSALTLGSLQGAADVTKAGLGRVILSAAADPTFNTAATTDITINAGALEMQNVGALGTSANGNLARISVGGGGLFYYNNATAGTIVNPLTLNGGTLAAGGNNQTYSGTFNLVADSTVSTRDLGVTIGTTRTVTLSGVISGAGKMTIDGNTAVASGSSIAGTVVVTQANPLWTGGFLLKQGTIDARNVDSLGTGAATVNLGRILFKGAQGTTWNQFANGLTIDNPGGTAVFELQPDNQGTVGVFTTNVTGTTTLGSATSSPILRVFHADALSATRLSGPVILANNASIHTSGGGTAGYQPVLIDGVISDGGNNFGVNFNGDATWGSTAYQVIRLAGANTFTGTPTLTAGTLEFSTVSNVGGPASNLGQGSAISIASGNLSFIGTVSQTTDRPITQTGSSTYSANGTPGVASITYTGAINPGVNNFTLGGSAGSEGFITGGISQTGDTADATVSGGSWTISGIGGRVADTLTVSGASAVLNLASTTPFFVRNDLIVTGAGSVLNLNATGVLSFSSPTLSADASLRVYTGGIINLGANNSIVTTDFDGMRIGTDGSGTGTLDMGTFNQTAVEFILGNRNADRIGIVNGTGVLTVTGNFDLYKGTINANLANASGATALEKIGNGTVTLAGDNSGLLATAASIVYEGTLALDYTNNTATKLRTATQLDIRGATLNLIGNATTPVSQSIGGLTLGSGGYSVISFTPNGQDLVLNLNAITRATNAQDGTLRFVLPSGTQSVTNGITTDATNNITGANGILGGWATVDNGSGVWFASNATNAADGNVVAATTTLEDSIASWVTGTNVSDSSGFTGSVTGFSVNSLRFNAAAGSDVSLGNTGVLGLASGGLLVTSNVSGASSILGGTLFSGAQASNVPELIITQDSAEILEIGADIRTNSAITKAGTGTLLLTGNNVYTGFTEIHNGTLQVSGGNAIGDNSAVTLAASRNSVLQLLNDETIGRLAGGSRNTDSDFGTVAIGSNTLTINQSGSTTYAGFLTGAGSIVMNTGSTGNLNLTNISTGFTGSVVVNGGLFQMSGSGQVNASVFTINKGGSLLIDNNGTTRSGTRILDTTPIFLNSADGPFSGQTIVRGLSIRIDQNAATNETIGNLVFNSGASYLSGDASGTTGRAAIIADNFIRNNSGTVNVRARNLGLAAGDRNNFRIGTTANENAFIATMVGDTGLAGTQNIKIVPWAIGEQTSAGLADANMGNSLVTYDVGNGFRALSFATEYDTLALAAATDNARESLIADLTSLAGTTVNALVINNNNTAASTVNITGTGAGQSLAVTSGALLFTLNPTATGAHNIVLGGFDNGITVGATNEYVFHVVNPSSAASSPTLRTTIASPLTSTADITKAGRGTLALTGTNSAGGGTRKTTINEGILEITDLDNIGGNTGGLVFAGGSLRLSSTYSGDDLSTRSLSFLNGGGTIDTNGSSVAFANGLGSGVGTFTKAGLGNLTLNASTTLTGGTILTGGTLTLGANNAIGSGDLSLGGGTTFALGSNNINVRLVTTSGTSPLLTGIGIITASNGFNFNHTGDTSISAVLAGAGRLLKTQANVLTLSGLNTYSGTTEIQSGILSFDSITNVGGGASALGSVANVENGIIRMGLGTAATTLNYTGTGHSSNRLVGMQGTTEGITLDADGTGALGLGGVRFENAGNKTLTLRGSSNALTIDNTLGEIREVGGVLTLNKSDSNTWLLNAVNFYTGATQVDNGTLKLGLNDALPLATTVRLGNATTAGTLDLNGFDQTVTSLISSSNSNTVTNNIIIDAGNTLTVTGAVTLGVNAATSTTRTSATGGGSFVNTNVGGTFQVGGATGTANANSSIVDFSGLASFTANLGSTGTFRIGDSATGTTLAPSSMRLATNNTITAGTLRVGDGSGGGTVHTLILGTGTNLINADTINVGSAGATIRSSGSVVFDAADTTGSVTFRASDGTSRAVINMVNTTGNTATDISSTVNLAGHTADILASTVTLAARTQSANAATATLTFDQGILDVTTLNMASRTGASTGNATATVNLGDSIAPGAPTTNIGVLNMAVNTSAGGAVVADLNVTGGNVNIGDGLNTGTAINMGNASAGRTVTSTLDLTGGVVNITGDIVRTGGAGTENATVTLAGSTLNLNGNSLGETTRAITFVAQSGMLTGLSELNGGGVLNKTTAGTLTLGNGNTYTGGTTLNGGTLLVNNTLGSATGTGAVTTVATTLLAGNGSIQANPNNNLAIGGNLSVGNSADVTGQVLTLGTSGIGTTTLGGSVSFDLFSGHDSATLNGLSASDRLIVSGSSGLTFDTNAALNLNTPLPTSSYTWTEGTSWQLFDWSGLTGGFTGSFSNLTGTQGNFVGLPDLSTFSLGWDISNLYSAGTIGIVVIPEPSRALLLLVGFCALGLRRRRK